MTDDTLINQVNQYYSDKVRQFGTTPQGVDWNSAEGQEIRFRQLLGVVQQPAACSLLDYGCGYGALYPLAQQQFPEISYTGFDISAEMIAAGKTKFPEISNWSTSAANLQPHDYVVASGIFNVMPEGTTRAAWENYILQTLDELDQLSVKGFSFNMLTSYSDAAFMKDYLFYADPAFYFDHCKRNYSKTVALLHDYPLWEFSIIVRKGIL